MPDPHLAELMAAQMATPYPPECRGLSIDGVELVLLDADIYGIATRYARNTKRMTDEDRMMLTRLLADVDRVWATLPTPEARTFYGMARDLGRYLMGTR